MADSASARLDSCAEDDDELFVKNFNLLKELSLLSDTVGSWLGRECPAARQDFTILGLG